MSAIITFAVGCGHPSSGQQPSSLPAPPHADALAQRAHGDCPPSKAAVAASVAAEEERFIAEIRKNGPAGILISGRFTADDLDAVLGLVRERDGTPVVSIIQRGDEVEVDTALSPLSGGNAFFLKKVDTKWTILRTSFWET